MSKDKLITQEKNIYLILAILLVGLRFFHFGPFIDEPHSWRQCDTAHYILDFYENGVDLLHPNVCWMGNHETVILEFPLPEAIVAWAYHLLGNELWVARVVFLLFFVGSAFFLWKIIFHLFSGRVAWFSSLIYLALPLSLYYSRAIHVDFSAMMFGLGGIYFLVTGIKKSRWRDWIGASIFLTIASLIKAPVLFALGLPVFFLLIRSKNLKSQLKFFPLLLLPLVAFYFWRKHVEAVNGAAPDWSFIPGYFPIVDMGGWYFGNWAQRTNSYNWMVLLERMSLELAGMTGLLFTVLGWMVNRKQQLFTWLWLLGLIIYFLIFFGLNLVHNYYQIPFLPFIALSIGLGLNWITEKGNRWIALAVCLLIIGENVIRSEFTTYPHNDRYYKQNDLFIPAGEFIEQNTSSEDYLLLAGPYQDPRSPFLMYRARRKGWPVNLDSLTTEIIRRLEAEGATQLVLLFKDSLSPAIAGFVEGKEKKTFSITRKDRTQWNIWIFKL